MLAKNRTFGAVLLLLMLIPFIAAAEDGDGGQAGAFLRIPINARANGMGGAFTAVVQDPSAGWWNPAGLGYVERFQVAGMYSILSMDRTHNFAGVALPLGKRGTIGVNWLQFGVSDIDGRDITGQPTGKFDDSEMAVGASYALKFGSLFSAGATAKYLHHSLQDFSASGFGLDLGVMLRIKERYQAGLVVQNLIGSIKWNTDSNLKETFPKVYRGGVGIKPGILPIPFLLAMDLAKVRGERGVNVHAGSEMWFVRDMFALRGGYAVDEFTVGASFAWNSSKLGFQLDYAFLQDKLDEGATNHISFLIHF